MERLVLGEDWLVRIEEGRGEDKRRGEGSHDGPEETTSSKGSHSWGIS